MCPVTEFEGVGEDCVSIYIVSVVVLLCNIIFAQCATVYVACAHLNIINIFTVSRSGLRWT